jgi:glycosyltransferase 2 family protein
VTRERASTLLKIAVSLAGLAYVLWQVPLADIGEVLVDIRWTWLVVTLLLTTSSLVLRAYRWHLLLRGLGLPIRFGRLVELYFVGNFFNAFLPSGFGGDAVRIIEVARDVPPTVGAGTVIVDRLTGLVMLFVMALLVLPFRPADFPGELALVVAGVSAAGIVGAAVLLDGRLIHRLGRRLPRLLAPTGDGPVARTLAAVHGCGWRSVGAALLVSTAFNLMLVGWWATSARALGLGVPYLYLVLIVPVLSVALLIPSISGLGVRESLAPILLAGAGLGRAEAVALSLVVFVVMRVSSLMGAPVYLYTVLRRNRKPTGSAPKAGQAD